MKKKMVESNGATEHPTENPEVLPPIEVLGALQCQARQERSRLHWEEFMQLREGILKNIGLSQFQIENDYHLIDQAQARIRHERANIERKTQHLVQLEALCLELEGRNKKEAESGRR